MKVQDFSNLEQENTSGKKYSLKFTQLSKYAPTMISDSRSNLNKFMSSVSKYMVKECRTTILVKVMDISKMIVHAQQVEEEKIMESERENKRSKNIKW